MTEWTVLTSPSSGWADHRNHDDCLFHSSSWMRLLEDGFQCSSLYARDESGRKSAGISVFRAGPFRVGYLGFPVGSDSILDTWPDLLRDELADHGLTCIRIPVTAFGRSVCLDLPYAATPETAITDLQSWSLEVVTKNRRRDVRKAQRSDLQIVDAVNAQDGETMHEQYCRTLARKSGVQRYTEAYFCGLIQLAQDHPNLRVLLAKYGEEIAGFTVVGCCGTTAYYLHGAFDWDMREYIPSAALLNEAIEWSQSQGCSVFNLMSSPPGQGSLVRYKEHWGAETRELRTYTLPLKPTYMLFRGAERLYRLVR